MHDLVVTLEEDDVSELFPNHLSSGKRFCWPLRWNPHDGRYATAVDRLPIEDCFESEKGAWNIVLAYSQVGAEFPRGLR